MGDLCQRISLCSDYCSLDPRPVSHERKQRDKLEEDPLHINLIAIAVGILLFFTQLPLPSVLTDTIDTLSSTIGPVSMLVLGMLLAEVHWKEVFTGKRIYLIVLLKW